MPNKQSQYFSILPMDALLDSGDYVTKQETQALYDIWNSEKDAHGHLVMPNSIDARVASSLFSKGVIKSISVASLVRQSQQQSVEITKRGKDIIKSIILQDNKSALEKAANSTCSMTKCASKKNVTDNWLSRSGK